MPTTVNARRYGRQSTAERRGLILLGAVVGDLRLAQIELALDPAPCLVREIAGTKKVVDPRALGLDQLELDLVMKLGELSVAFVSVAVVIRVPQPVTQVRTQRSHRVIRELALCRQTFERVERSRDPLPPGGAVFHSLAMALAPSGIGKAEGTDDARQQQALAHQRDHDHREG